MHTFKLTHGSKVIDIEIIEQYGICNYGLNPEFSPMLEKAGLRIAGVDLDGEVLRPGSFQNYASFILAVDRIAELNDGQTADFIPIVCNNDLAVSAEKYLRKGRHVYLEGRLNVRSYEEDSQNRRWVTEVVARNIQYLDAPPEDNGRNHGGSGQQQQ